MHSRRIPYNQRTNIEFCISNFDLSVGLFRRNGYILAFSSGEGGPSRRWMRRSNFVQYKRRAPHPSLAILLRKMYHFVNAIATFPTGEGLGETNFNTPINTNLSYLFIPPSTISLRFQDGKGYRHRGGQEAHRARLRPRQHRFGSHRFR